MSTEDNKAISQRIAEAIGAGDFATLKELMAPNVYQEFEQSLRELRAAFPDYHGTNIDTIAEGDKVAQRWTYYGTHQGPFMGIAPTGKQVTFNGMSIDQYADGKMVNLWVQVDMLGVLQQLGAAPPLDPSSLKDKELGGVLLPGS